MSWLFPHGNGNAAGPAFPLSFPTRCSCVTSTQPDRTTLQELCAQALVALKGGCSPGCWRWPGIQHCVETTTASPLLGRAPVPHAIFCSGGGQEALGDAGLSFQPNTTWAGPWPFSLCLTTHAPKLQALFPGLLTVLGKKLAPAAGTPRFSHLQSPVFTALQTPHRAALVLLLQAGVSCSCLGQCEVLSSALLGGLRGQPHKTSSKLRYPNSGPPFVKLLNPRRDRRLPPPRSAVHPAREPAMAGAAPPPPPTLQCLTASSVTILLLHSPGTSSSG